MTRTANPPPPPDRDRVAIIAAGLRRASDTGWDMTGARDHRAWLGRVVLWVEERRLCAVYPLTDTEPVQWREERRWRPARTQDLAGLARTVTSSQGATP